jgi:hypothetical protein
MGSYCNQSIISDPMTIFFPLFPGSNEATMTMIETVNAPGFEARRDLQKETEVLRLLSAHSKIEAWASPVLPMNGRHVCAFLIR